MYEYKAKVTRVVDGDTFHADVDLGFRMTASMVFRLANIDTPETYRPKSIAEREHGENAKQFVIGAIGDSDVTIVTHKTGKYGRWIAEVKYYDASNILLDLTEQLKLHGFDKLQYNNGIYGG